MKFIKDLIEYFNASTQNKILCIAIAALALIIIILLIAAIVHGVKKSKRKKEEALLAEQTSEKADGEAAQIPAETADDAAPIAETPAEEAPATEVSAEDAPAAETPTDEEAPAPIAEAPAEQVQEEAPAPIAQMPADEEAPAAEAAEEEAAETETPATEETAAEKQAAAPAEEETSEKPDAKAAAEEDRRPVYAGKWVIRKHDDSEAYYFELLASNGEKLLSSIDYTSVQGARNGIKTHKANIARGNFTIASSKSRQYFFRLLSGSKQILCTGETYKTKSSCESAIESVKRFAETAVIVVDRGEEDN